MKPFDQFILWIKIILLFIFLPLALKAQNNQTVNAGSQTTSINFPVTTCIYQWTNSNPAIGLPASGTGDIGAFTAINNTGIPITATIKATTIGPQVQPPLLYIPNYDSNDVSVINALTNTLLTTIPVGISPKTVQMSNDYNRVYIGNEFSNDVSVIYMPTNRVIATIPGFSKPAAIAVAPNNDIVYVANTGSNTVSVVNALNNTISSTIQVGPNPVGLSLNHSGTRLYVTSNGRVQVINTATLTVIATISVGLPTYALLSPDESKLYVSQSFSNEVKVISTATNTLIDRVVLGSIPHGLAISPDGSRLYVGIFSLAGNVSVINTATNTIISTATFGANTWGLSINNDGSLLYATQANSNTVEIMNTTEPLSHVATVNVGVRPNSVGNFYLTRADCGAPITFTITVNPAAIGPTISTTSSPSAVSTIYGTASTPTSFFVSGNNMTGGIVVTPPSAFEVSLDGTNFTNTVTIPGTGTINSTRVYIRLKKTNNAGNYNGDIVLTSPGAAAVNVAMPLSTVGPVNVVVNTIGNIRYGITVSSFHATTANFDFSTINSFLKNGETASGMDINISGGANSNDPVGTYPNAIISANLQGTNGFLASNYSISYTAGNIVRYPAPLTIKADNVTKVAGTALTGASGSIDFSYTALQNSESVNSVTIAYGNGAAVNAAPGTYTGSVTASALIGSNGFLASNYAITYLPGNITVTALPPVITVLGTLQPLTTVYGTPSLSTSFLVAATDLTAGILITPPAGFEVSTDNSVFSPTVTIGSTGNLAPTPIYIRLKQTSFVASYSGNIRLQSAGSADVHQTMPASTVTPAPLLITAGQLIKMYGSPVISGPGLTGFRANGLKNGENVGSVTITYGAGAAVTANVGNYNASAVPSDAVGGSFSATNYDITYQSNFVTVIPSPVFVTANNASKFYGDANPTFTLKYSGFVTSDGIAQLTTLPVATSTATVSSPVGQYPITVSGGISTNYTFNYIAGVLTVNPAPYSPITIPNTFTPNGDGINDKWNIVNLDTYPKITVTIFNRNGTQVYFSNGYTVAWDGNYNGGQVPLGTYYYVITGVNTKPITGYVAVIR